MEPCCSHAGSGSRYSSGIPICLVKDGSRGDDGREPLLMFGVTANSMAVNNTEKVIRAFQVAQGLTTGAENTWTVLDEKMSGL
ncbi:hypothetical protein [Citrobacter braakii]|uniref:hypothetical protein n=1 Tax=Citrobacter braakii TaxID=57706 RepID=UPI00403A0B26